MREFLSEARPFTECVDSLSLETAVESYAMFGTMAKTATLNIESIDTELRAELCDKQDAILERIIDLSTHTSTCANGIYTPAVQGFRRWKNVELMKDKCLTGYMLAKELDAHPVMMFGTKPDDYPYMEVLPGLEILYSEGEIGAPDVYFEHLVEKYAQMDTLILHGMYEQTIGYLIAYRKLRPDGKVYCGLDMNGYWMSRIDWNSEAARSFAGQSDVIATSCRSLRDALNRNPKVHFPCRWFPNGFYNPTGLKVTADADSKRNIILTAGRIGARQKNNGELLVAFARISGELAGWSLRLVGSIEPEFKEFISQYFTVFPHLKERVIFTGAITDKAELYKEYALAKIFALTSQFEGGTPNVYAEALFHGCMFVTSDIDAADDITNFGKLGQQYKLGDIDGLAGALVNLAKNADRRELQRHIPKALDYAHKYYDWHRNAKKLAYMLYN
jgi:glycosyltransferase involved in cell wall biosynthesis